MMHFSLLTCSHTHTHKQSRVLPPNTESVFVPTGPDSSANAERAASWRAAEDEKKGRVKKKRTEHRE